MQGVFKLYNLAVGKESVMCSHSRLLSGSVMKQNSVLLEHTLVVSALVEHTAVCIGICCQAAG